MVAAAGTSNRTVFGVQTVERARATALHGGGEALERPLELRSPTIPPHHSDFRHERLGGAPRSAESPFASCDGGTASRLIPDDPAHTLVWSAVTHKLS